MAVESKSKTPPQTRRVIEPHKQFLRMGKIGHAFLPGGLKPVPAAKNGGLAPGAGKKKVRPNKQRWAEKFEAVQQFYVKRKRWPLQRKDGALGSWCDTQRQAKKGQGSCTISPAQIAQLDQIGFNWGREDVPWDVNCEAVYQFRVKNGKWPTQREGAIGKWCSHQRQAKKGKGSCRISPAQIAKLDKIGFDWGTTMMPEEKLPDCADALETEHTMNSEIEPLQKPQSVPKREVDAIAMVVSLTNLNRAEAMHTLRGEAGEIPGNIKIIEGKRTHPGKTGAFPLCYMVTAAGESYIKSQIKEGLSKSARKPAQVKKTTTRVSNRTPRVVLKILEEEMRKSGFECTSPVVAGFDKLAGRYYEKTNAATKHRDPGSKRYVWTDIDRAFLRKFLCGNSIVG